MHPAIHSGLCHLRNLIIIIIIIIILILILILILIIIIIIMIIIIIIIISKIFYEEDSVTPRWFSWGFTKNNKYKF